MSAIYGHRGARGLFPENTLKGFKELLQLPVQGFELDIVVTQDKELIVSHNPFAHHDISLTPQGKEIKEEEERSHNFYEMRYEQVRQYDVGTKKYSDFPEQNNCKSEIPLLSQVFELMNEYVDESFVLFLEVKLDEKYSGKFYPYPEEYAVLLANFLDENDFKGKLVIKSFNPNFLNSFYSIKGLKHDLGLLVENDKSIKENLNNLHFKPAYYNLQYRFLAKGIVDELHQENMKLVTWTVNEKSAFKKSIELGVDGIITDYPNNFTLEFLS